MVYIVYIIPIIALGWWLFIKRVLYLFHCSDLWIQMWYLFFHCEYQFIRNIEMSGVPSLWKHPFPILRALKHCWKVGQKWSKGQGLSHFVCPPGTGGKRWWPCRLCPCCHNWPGWVPGINQTVPSRCRENLLRFLIQENYDSSWTQNNRPFGRAKITQEKAFRQSFMPHPSADKAGLGWSQLRHISWPVLGKSTE